MVELCPPPNPPPQVFLISVLWGASIGVPLQTKSLVASTSLHQTAVRCQGRSNRVSAGRVALPDLAWWEAFLFHVHSSSLLPGDSLGPELLSHFSLFGVLRLAACPCRSGQNPGHHIHTLASLQTWSNKMCQENTFWLLGYMTRGMWGKCGCLTFWKSQWC